MTIVTDTSALTELATVKTALEIELGDSSENVYLTGVILQMSSTIETYLDRTLGTGQFVQSKNFQYAVRLPNKIFLVKYPVTVLGQVSYKWQDGTEVILDSEEYFFESDEGILTLTDNGRQLLQTGLGNARAAAAGSGYITIEVTHTGGYDLPGVADTGAMDLPQVIERACIDLVKNQYYVRSQNPAVKTEMVPDVLQQTFFQPDAGGGGFSTSILNGLDSYLDLRQTF